MSSDDKFKERSDEIERKFVGLGHQPENKSCDHKHYSFEKHGRHCTCGTIMVDFGD